MQSLKHFCALSLLALIFSCSSDDSTGDGASELNTTPMTATSGTMPASTASIPESSMMPAAPTPTTPPVITPGPSTTTPPSTPPTPTAASGDSSAPGSGEIPGEMSMPDNGGTPNGNSTDAGATGSVDEGSAPEGNDSMGSMPDAGSANEPTGGNNSGEPGMMANPSPGCGKGGRPDGGKVYNAGVSWISFPESYDGTTPLKVLWAWHGCGAENFGTADNTEYWGKTRGTVFEDEYVIAIPLAASGNCFDYNTDIIRTKALYDELTQNYCVDLDHMFGTGHSSGANFVHNMLTGNHAADWEYLGLRGIAPVASGPVNGQSTQIPVMYIHSPSESVDPNGPAGNFRVANGCEMSSQPYPTAACNSIQDGDPVNSNCISYDGCDVETIFCPHDDSNYGGTFHGIPCFFYAEAHQWFMTL